MKFFFAIIFFLTILFASCTSNRTIKERSFDLYECAYYQNFKITIIGFTDIDYEVYAHNNQAEYTGIIEKNIFNEKASRRECTKEDSNSFLNFSRQEMN